MSVQIQGVGVDHQAATFIVAAADSPHPGQADYVCGGADDQVIINACLAEGDTELMMGTFHTSAPIQMKKSFSNLSGAGHGWNLGGTMIYLDDNSDCNMIEISGTENRVFFATVHDLYLDGNKGNNASGHGIYVPTYTVNHVSDQMFYNLGIHGMKEDGMHILNGWYMSLFNVWCEVCGGRGAKIVAQSTISHSVFSSNLGNGLEVADLCHILNSSIEQNVGHGIIFNGSNSSMGHCMIRGNSETAAGVNHGIVVWSADDITIANNTIQGSAKQGHGIYTGAGAERINIHDNNVSDNVTSQITANGTGKVHHNTGFVTESSGTATLLNTTTSIAVPHSLAVTPVAGDIVVTPIEAWGNMTTFYIGNYTTTHFTIYSPIDPGQDVDFAWKAIVL